jgi:L-iditol 2-dehydrogenase
VLGAGTVGLLTAAMARQSGCTTVTVCDVDQGRVDYALGKGFATHGYVVPRLPHAPSRSSSASAASTLDGRLEAARAAAAAIHAASFGATSSSPPLSGDEAEDDGFDVTFECTGKEACMHTALYATRPGGKVVMVGMGTPIQTLPMSVAHLREVDILGIFRYANTYATGIRMLCAQKTGGAFGLPSLDDMVTHRFKGLENAAQAFELAGRTVDAEGRMVLKVVIEA